MCKSIINERHSQHVLECVAIDVYFYNKTSEPFLFFIQYRKFSITNSRVPSGLYNIRVNLLDIKLLVKNITITCAFTLAFLRHLNVPPIYVYDHF